MLTVTVAGPADAGVRLRDAIFPADCAAVRALLLNYQAAIGVDLCFQNFSAELRDLPGSYAAPAGFVLCAEHAVRLVGCVALKPLQSAAAEMKRLYVEPAHRGAGVARRLVIELLARARALGYQRIMLDTLPAMTGAQRLYSSLGFVDIEAYASNPIAGVRYMALELR